MMSLNEDILPPDREAFCAILWYLSLSAFIVCTQSILLQHSIMVWTKQARVPQKSTVCIGICATDLRKQYQTNLLNRRSCLRSERSSNKCFLKHSILMVQQKHFIKYEFGLLSSHTLHNAEQGLNILSVYHSPCC